MREMGRRFRSRAQRGASRAGAQQSSRITRGLSRAAVPACLTGALVSACGTSIAAAAKAKSSTNAKSSTPSFAQACGTKSVTLTGDFETGFPDIINLTKLFSKQHPSVHWKINTNAYAEITTNAPLVLAGQNAPDLVRLPILEGLVKDHLLLSLNKYYNEYHWNSFPSSVWAQNRTNGSQLGTGPIYAWGLNSQVTGIYYNKALARKLGMKGTPKTLGQLEGLFAKAKHAGLTPIEVWNAVPTGLTFPLQQLMADYGSVNAINNWAYDKPGANIDTPANVRAATVLASWIKDGYFNSDATAQTYSGAMSEWTAPHSKDVFLFNGNWQAGSFDTSEPGKYGFFAMPPVKAGGHVAAIIGPLQYGIAAKAPHPACTAYFLNWVSTNPAARKLNVEQGGAPPIGPTKLSVPRAKPGTNTEESIQVGVAVAKDNQGMGFITNANGSIYTESETPELQSLFAGQTTPAAVMKSIQSAYRSEGS
jgi:raffinose/stachyose/melibiose transport system substrate-binding protein